MKSYFNCKRNDEMILFKLSSIITYPKTEPQMWHRDGDPILNNRELVTFALYLTDIPEIKGPTEFYPGTQYSILNKTSPNYTDPITKGPNKDNYVKLAGVKGDIGLWDGYVVHRGGPNSSKYFRPIFVITLVKRNSLFGQQMLQAEKGGAIHPKYKNININYLLSS